MSYLLAVNKFFLRNCFLSIICNCNGIYNPLLYCYGIFYHTLFFMWFFILKFGKVNFICIYFILVSVILILESFDVYFGKESVFLERGSSVLVDSSSRDFFLTYPERVIVADFGAEFISRYLKANNLRDISDCREYPSYLKINFADFSLIKGLISWANHCAEYIEIFDESIAFTCLSAFSSEKQFGVFLFECLKSTGAKVKTIIHTDLSAPWRLKDISSRLYLSEGLLKRKLKEEGVSFSKIILDERMQMAEYLLSTRCYPISKVAKVCGYASVSYFTYVFRRYFGVSPSQYSQRSSESKILTHQGI